MDRLGLLSRSVSCGSLVSVAAAMVLAGFVPHAAAAEPFDSYTDMGVLRLQLGQWVPPRLVYETPGKPDDRGSTSVSQLAEQIFLLSGKCGGSLDDRTGAVQLATMASGPGPLGFGPDSIGVYDGPKGVACYRISAGVGEWVRFNLGSYLKEQGARSFYRLEIDLEVKQNARFELDVLRAGEVFKTYVLESGGSIQSGTSTIPGANPWACTARSDSGPDAGAGDNCRWIINELGDGYTLRATAGEGSLEGGGDFAGDAYNNNTLVYLTNVAVGALACGGTTPTIDIGHGIEGAQCQVASPPEGYGQDCNIFYAFKDITGNTKGCEFIKEPGEQLAASMDITFPPEPRTDLYNVPPTFFEFPGRTEYFQPDVCNGTLIDEDENGDPVNPTIEMSTLTTYDQDGNSVPVTIANDAVPTPANSLLDWACILEQTIDYLGDDAMQIRQTILFWGDPAAIRF